MMRNGPLLEAHGLVIGYARSRRPPRIVAEDINIDLKAGEFVCLLGPNGAGKSTLIRTLAGMQRPLSGNVRLAGEPLSSFSISARAKKMSLVLTERVAVGMMQVNSVVALGRYPFTNWNGSLRSEDREAVESAIRAVGIERLTSRPYFELSDGERQKVMIARALAQEPQVMILDEATAFLDLPRRVELMHLLRQIAHKGRRAILLSTHDLDLALRWADRLWLLHPESPLRQGIPEDLVLTDAFAKNFASEGINFDKASGAFRFNGSEGRIVALLGKGVPAIWTCRALERVGFRVVQDGEAEECIEVIEDGEAVRWRIRGSEATYLSLEALLSGLGAYRAVLPVDDK